MSEVRPVVNRELLLGSDIRASLKRKVDPLIERALASSGYTELQTPTGRTYLSDAAIFPSEEYLAIFERRIFDAVSVRLQYNVDNGERRLSRSIVDLHTVGGIATAQIVGIGETYKINTNVGSGLDTFSPVDKTVLATVLQDIRAHTTLGYGSEDELPAPETTIEQLAKLHTGQNVDRSAHFEMIPDNGYGDTRMDIGESFEIKRQDVGGRTQTRRLNTKRLFELNSVLPLNQGSVRFGTRYTSGRRQFEAKLTAELEGTNFNSEQQQVMYDEIVHTFQHRDPNKFGAGIIKNLNLITDPDSDILRLG